MDEKEKSPPIELRKVKWEIEKLKAEIISLRSNNFWENRITRYIPLATVLIAILSFGIGIYQFRKQQEGQIENLKTDFNNKISLSEKESINKVLLSEKENRNKFYQKQIDVYFEVTKIAAQISVEDNESKIKKLYRQFSELSYGNLAVVQDKSVMKAVSDFNDTYGDYQKKLKNQNDLRNSAKQIADACKHSLGDRWSIPFIVNNE